MYGSRYNHFPDNHFPDKYPSIISKLSFLGNYLSVKWLSGKWLSGKWTRPSRKSHSMHDSRNRKPGDCGSNTSAIQDINAETFSITYIWKRKNSITWKKYVLERISYTRCSLFYTSRFTTCWLQKDIWTGSGIKYSSNNHSNHK